MRTAGHPAGGAKLRKVGGINPSDTNVANAELHSSLTQSKPVLENTVAIVLDGKGREQS